MQVYLATTEYSSELLSLYSGHHTPINNIKFNTFVPDVFMTCASEFTVIIWHRDEKKPIFEYDLGSVVSSQTSCSTLKTPLQVGDIAWAPYSSTVLAAVTDDGKVMMDPCSVAWYSVQSPGAHL